MPTIELASVRGRFQAGPRSDSDTNRWTMRDRTIGPTNDLAEARKRGNSLKFVGFLLENSNLALILNSTTLLCYKNAPLK